MDVRKVYGPYYDGSGKRRIVIVLYADGTRRTKAHARYLLEQRLGRDLTEEEEADHIDGDPLNDSLDNLQVLSVGAHRIKTARERPREWLVFNCPECGEETAKPRSVVEGNRRQGKAGPFCGKRCAGRATR